MFSSPKPSARSTRRMFSILPSKTYFQLFRTFTLLVSQKISIDCMRDVDNSEHFLLVACWGKHAASDCNLDFFVICLERRIENQILKRMDWIPFSQIECMHLSSQFNFSSLSVCIFPPLVIEILSGQKEICSQRVRQNRCQ